MKIWLRNQSCFLTQTTARKTLLYQLIYSSRASRDLTNSDLSSIISTAQKNNLTFGVTGALCYAQGTFVQCLEGEQCIIDKLYQYLQKDEKHEQLKTLDRGEIYKRRFPNWTMGFFSYENEVSQLFLQHATMAECAPFSMSASACNEFFDEVLKYVTVPKKEVFKQVPVFSNQFTPSAATGMSHLYEYSVLPLPKQALPVLAAKCEKPGSELNCH